MQELDKFQAWIKSNTATKISKDLGISYVTVFYWYLRHTAPRPKDALRIIKMSNLSWSDIYLNFALGKKLKKVSVKRYTIA
jgi:hypothetical protein